MSRRGYAPVIKGVACPVFLQPFGRFFAYVRIHLSSLHTHFFFVQLEKCSSRIASARSYVVLESSKRIFLHCLSVRLHLPSQVFVAPVTCRQSRARSTSISSTTSHASMASIYARINQNSLLAEPKEGHTNVYGSFTTTIPATLWLRNHLSLHIPVSGEQRHRCGYDTPPDSPLSFFQSLPGSSRRSPSISRTLLTDFDWGGPSMGPLTSPPSSPLSSPLTDNDDGAAKLHPVLRAVERGSKLSCKTVCSTCMIAGTNFPRCPRCDEMWCSRACRLQGGKKHVCALRKM